MADLSQRVVWSLDYRCPIRDSDSPGSPSEVEAALGPAVQYEHALRGGSDSAELIGDTVVTSVRSLSDPFQLGALSRLNFPESGWSVSEALASWGGASQVFSLCGKCPANPGRLRLGGCSGSLDMDPDSKVLDDLLGQALVEAELTELYRLYFESTTPLWYGLWIKRQLDGDKQVALQRILQALEKDGEATGLQWDRTGLHRLIAALDHAVTVGIGMQVELLPPRRQVLDLLNTFPHCPRCRGAASDQAWQRPYPTHLHTCSVCGSRFSPAETVSAIRVPDPSGSLYDGLGKKGYREMLETYLERRGIHGENAARISRIVEKTIEKERAFRVHLDSLKERRQQYLKRHVFFGLEPLLPPPSGVLNDEHAGVNDEQTWFGAEDFEAVLHRVVSLGVTVRYMTHMGSDVSLERHVWEGIDDPLAIFREWIESGCQSKFSALLLVPPSMLKEEEP